MEKQFQPVFDHLNSDRPSFLFLGQDYLALETGRDHFLSSVLLKYAAGDKEVNSYRNLLIDCKFEDESAARTWIADTTLRLVTPKWLEIVSTMSWNGIYTSAIDTQITRTFRNDWRAVQPIFSKKFSPADARNPANLHVTYLFGGIEREEYDERTPLNEIDLIRRSADAIIMLSRLSEQVTPFGMLFIEGYNPSSDWLKAQELATMLLSLEPGQAHFFSARDQLRKDPLLSRLAQSGQIILHEDSLATFLNEGNSSGALSFSVKSSLRRYGHYLSLGDKAIEVPENIWTQVGRSATIVDDDKLQSPRSQSAEKKYSSFRNFLAESATAPIWAAYSNGFALKRDFEDELHSRFQSRLKYKASSNDPIILHGQTGTGKTVSLGSLAYRIRKEGQCAVLFIERHPQGPIAADLDVFCKWADDSGFSATVLIWDGMIYVDQYTALLKNLIGRGRNVILIGSTYRADQNDEKRRSYVLAPPNLNDNEVNNFRNLLSQFEPTLGDRLANVIQEHDATFLVALYRLLPETRSQVRHGLQRETGAAEVFI
ncbi:P-loop NTPase, partial [Burkholderia cepacia]|uniref:P-loop NTPase n=1 Tax=Burkholderia cepacia TaxID=292 RepID=UPI002ABDD91A